MTHHNTKSITKGIIFYSNGVEEPISSLVREILLEMDLPITASFSEGRSYPNMVKQIIDCLERAEQDVVFFCEHDVIYNETHFHFTPEKSNIFYYNEHVWRWDYPKERYYTYDRLISLSGMCCYRELALKHFKDRLEFITKNGYDKDTKGEPHWMRKMGFEPGTKKKKRGGFSDHSFETFYSKRPLIDIRHKNTFSPRKVNLKDFKHPPMNWVEIYERP